MTRFIQKHLFDHKWTGGQYSIVRALFGIFLTIYFVYLLPWAAELFSNTAALPNASASPFAYVFPSILSLFDAPWFVTLLVGIAALASIAFTIGARSKAMAILILYIGACLFVRNPLINLLTLTFVGWMLLFHATIPGTPFGSWSARGRTNPNDGWQLPRSFFTATWLVMAAGYSYSGYTKLISPSWQGGSAITSVLQSPLARTGPIRDLMLALPDLILQALTYSTLALELLTLPLALIARLRPWLWLSLVSLHIGILTTVAFADLNIGMLLIHLFTFNPAWIPGKKAADIEHIFYDGACGLCQRWVRLVLAEDPGPDYIFRFAPLESDAFESILTSLNIQRDTLPDSIIVTTADGQLLTHSAAVFHILNRLGGLWRLAALTGSIIPRPIRDFTYDAIALVRHKFFPRPTDACPLIPPEMRERFDY